MMSKAFFGILLSFLLGACSTQAQPKPAAAITTEHGYRFTNYSNKGGQKPKMGETVLYQVEVWVGKTLLDSSRKNKNGGIKYELAPPSNPGEAVRPLTDAALLMGKGDSATIFQPLDTFALKFIPPEARNEKEIRFELVLLDIISAEEKSKEAQAMRAYADGIKQKVQATAQRYVAGQLAGSLVTRPSGLKMLVETPGNGPKVKEAEAVQVHYYGMLTNGTPFDNSYERQEPLGFPAGVGQMIPGFDEGLMQLNHGGKAYLFIPYQLAYGEAGQGPIPPKAELVFYIEVL